MPPSSSSRQGASRGLIDAHLTGEVGWGGGRAPRQAPCFASEAQRVHRGAERGPCGARQQHASRERDRAPPRTALPAAGQPSRSPWPCQISRRPSAPTPDLDPPPPIYLPRVVSGDRGLRRMQLSSHCRTSTSKAGDKALERVAQAYLPSSFISSHFMRRGGGCRRVGPGPFLN